jgi:MerR family transcriptional regulator, light-induced transcriptional regulator
MNNLDIPDASPVAKRHPIQVVAQRTGLTADVIRIWERRYDAVQPERAANNQRFYSDEDIQRLRLLRIATEAGRRISAVAKLGRQELEALVAEDDKFPVKPEGNTPSSRANTGSEQFVQECLDAVIAMNPRALDLCLARANRSLGTIQMLNNLISPLLNQIGSQWREGKVRTCQEHMASAHIRSFLGQLVIHANTDENGPKIIVCTPPNQLHELGALMSSVIAATSGWQVIYLGPNVPVEEIAFSAEHADALAVALSINYPGDDVNLPRQLQALRQQLPAHVKIVAGGATASNYSEALHALGVMTFSDLLQFGQFLDAMRSAR